ncbi:hypothetical protein EVAR_87862_1 [Eumeta japonica]|uniref:Uncharacterized protein n=1 Tax=Eumeta variegata TaxID=151549 RepID=A0A4C1WV85_EUMVA|nr:hypothetical protein EVAR_87862_1 [Eumeta japonica]
MNTARKQDHARDFKSTQQVITFTFYPNQTYPARDPRWIFSTAAGHSIRFGRIAATLHICRRSFENTLSARASRRAMISAGVCSRRKKILFAGESRDLDGSGSRMGKR